MDPGERCAGPARPSLLLREDGFLLVACPFLLGPGSSGELGTQRCELSQPHDLHITPQPLPACPGSHCRDHSAPEFLASRLVPALLWPPQLDADRGPGEQQAHPSVLPSQGLPASSRVGLCPKGNPLRSRQEGPRAHCVHAPRPPEATVKLRGHLLNKRRERGSQATRTVGQNESSLVGILQILSGPFPACSVPEADLACTPRASGGLSPARSN